MSGETEASGQNGYFTGAAQASMLGINQGGIAWIIEIYDGTPNAPPIYKWDWYAEKYDNEEIKCGLADHHSFSTVIRSNGSDIFRRATRIRAVAAPAQWAHC
jgi:hypothetical protein